MVRRGTAHRIGLTTRRSVPLLGRDSVALSLELANSVSFFDDNEDFLDVLSLTARFMGERLQPYIAVGAPLDDTRDDISLFIAGGIQFVP